MARITTSDVQDIYDTVLDSGSIDAHIEAAEVLVDDVAAADSSISDSRLATIQKYVAAHLVALQDPRVTSERIGDGQWKYDTQTNYMEMAMALDPTSTLSPDSQQPSIYVADGRNIEEVD